MSIYITVFKCICMHEYMYVCMHVYIVCVYTCVCMHPCVYACMYICMHVCIHVCIYVIFKLGFVRYRGGIVRGRIIWGNCPGNVCSPRFGLGQVKHDEGYLGSG